MSRSLRVPLSPSEEITLRQVDMAVWETKLRPDDVDRLVRLFLVKRRNGRLAVTETGLRRLAIIAAGPPPLAVAEIRPRPVE